MSKVTESVSKQITNYVTKYADPEPTWGTWGNEETLLAGRSFGYIIG